MLFTGQPVLWISVVFGFLCGICAVAVNLYYDNLKDKTNKLFDLYNRLFLWLFAGFLIFCVSPAFLFLISSK